MGESDFVAEAGSDHDFSGTAAADLKNPEVGDRDLHERLGLAREDWSVVGYDMIAVGGGMAGITVYAVDLRDDLAGVDFDGLQRIARERGGMPVTELKVQNWVDPGVFIEQNFKSLSVTLAHRNTERRGHRLDVVDKLDIEYDAD